LRLEPGMATGPTQMTSQPNCTLSWLYNRPALIIMDSHINSKTKESETTLVEGSIIDLQNHPYTWCGIRFVQINHFTLALFEIHYFGLVLLEIRHFGVAACHIYMFTFFEPNGHTYLILWSEESELAIKTHRKYFLSFFIIFDKNDFSEGVILLVIYKIVLG